MCATVQELQDPIILIRDAKIVLESIILTIMWHEKCHGEMSGN